MPNVDAKKLAAALKPRFSKARPGALERQLRRARRVFVAYTHELYGAMTPRFSIDDHGGVLLGVVGHQLRAAMLARGFSPLEVAQRIGKPVEWVEQVLEGQIDLEIRDMVELAYALQARMLLKVMPANLVRYAANRDG